MGNKRAETRDNVYGAIERQLRDENFDVKHLMRDSGGDWADDGGYLISISEKNDKIYLHIIRVNYNGYIDSNVLDENDHRITNGSRKESDIQDYIKCTSIEDAQTKLNKFVDLLDITLTDDVSWYFENGYIDHDDDKPEGFETFDNYYLEMLCACWFPFSEYHEIDAPILRNLTNIEYVADYTDPTEYTED